MAATQPPPDTPKKSRARTTGTEPATKKKTKRRGPVGAPDADANKRRLPVVPEVDVPVSTILEPIIQASPMTLKEIAEEARISEPQLYRWRYTKNTWTLAGFLYTCQAVDRRPDSILARAGLLEPLFGFEAAVMQAGELDQIARLDLLDRYHAHVEELKARKQAVQLRPVRGN